MKACLLLLAILFTACTSSDGFDDASIPADQKATQFAFTRMAKHGEIAPVVEVDQQLTEWQFYVNAPDQPVQPSVNNPVTVFTLSDRSGINYTVSSESTPADIFSQLEIGSYGYGSGRITTVDRDHVAREINVVIELTNWRTR